jgi:predicted Zn-dependent protease with MMP-like domain
MTSDWEELLRVAREEVTATLAELPGNLRERAEALPVCYERRPNRALVADGLDPDVLGLFVGPDFGVEGHFPLPAQIILFVENIFEMVGGDDAEFRSEVRATFLHELGHYLGLDEDDLDERGLL